MPIPSPQHRTSLFNHLVGEVRHTLRRGWTRLATRNAATTAHAGSRAPLPRRLLAALRRPAPVLLDSLAVTTEHRREFVGMNVAYWGIVGTSMLTATLSPALRRRARTSVRAQLNTPGMGAAVTAAYGRRNPIVAALLTFLVNLLVAAVGTTTLPSLLVPFLGVAFSALRAWQWGMLFAPTWPNPFALLPHYLTLAIEGEAYIVATLAAWIHEKATVQSILHGVTMGSDDYRVGLHATLQLYPLVIAGLAAGAAYEAFEVIHLLPRFRGQAGDSPTH